MNMAQGEVVHAFLQVCAQGRHEHGSRRDRPCIPSGACTESSRTWLKERTSMRSSRSVHRVVTNMAQGDIVHAFLQVCA
jgi:hypothetical protein